MVLFASLIFTSAFLLFQVQPLIAKAILPWFGGSAMVWTSCMLFFQVVLLGGYAYANWLVRRPARQQRVIHAALLALSLLTLPVTPSAALAPAGGDQPLAGILLVLTAAVGMPYLMLAANGPLLQSWYATRFGRLPYRLFALSNTGSLLALLGYPALIEPRLRLAAQSWAWSFAYAAFVAACLWLIWRERGAETAADLSGAEPGNPASVAPSWQARLSWLVLPACASALLLTITNHLSQNVAAIPLLWVVPLAVYLLSFMLTFDSDRWYLRPWVPALCAAALAAMAYPFWIDLDTVNIGAAISAYSTGLFLCCFFCHGEVARRRPAPAHLTSFYLTIAAGGALGGLAVSLAAPLLLPYSFDLSVSLALLGIAGMMTVYREQWWCDVLWAGVAIFLIVTVYQDVILIYRDNSAVARNFYGGLRVRESGTEFDQSKIRTLVHGTINHGAQFVDRRRSRTPTTYYSERSGVGLALADRSRPGRRVGVIGLGTGTLLAYARPGDQFKIYEINPLVVEFARSWFTFLRESPAPPEIVLGDARLSLEREAPNGFDVLAVDAFSSDAIPVHLLTREAMVLYFRHLRPDGILAVHISNKYLNLYPVVRELAGSLGKAHVLVENLENTRQEQFASEWVLVAGLTQMFDTPAFRAAASKPDARRGPLWTDDYSNLLRVRR